VDKQLALDVAARAQLESGNVTGHIKVVAAGSCEEVFTAASGESDITAVLVARGKAYECQIKAGLSGRETYQEEVKDM
jgi:coenzyme F420-reducing hydrogenase delta subunit